MTIPASYFFKDVYSQHWEDDTTLPAATDHRSSFIGGLMMPIAGAIRAVFHRRDRNPVRHYGVHAYD